MLFSTAVSSFVQFRTVNIEDIKELSPSLFSALKSLPAEQLMTYYFSNKLCNFAGVCMDWCNNKQSRYLGVIKASASAQPSKATLRATLSKLSSFGIAEAFDLSICLILYKTKVAGSLVTFNAKCAKGLRLNGTGTERDANAKGHLGKTDNKSQRSEALYHRLRKSKAGRWSNPALMHLIERSHSVDIMLYNIAVEVFIAEVRAMSKSTGLAFDIPPCLLHEKICT
jgi:hypothetical protein